MKKIIFKFAGNFDVEGRPRHYQKGQVDIVSDEDAARLIDDLQAEIYTEKEQQKTERNNGNRKNKQ